MPQFELNNSEDHIRAQIRRLKIEGRSNLRRTGEMAVDYLNGNMVDDVKAQLHMRHNASQKGGSGQEIFPITIPLTERFIAESATAYNKSVTRTLKTHEGEETDETRRLTLEYNRILAKARYDELLQRNDEHSNLLKTSVVWYQAKRGTIRPVVTMPYDVYPVAPSGPQFVDASDADDYDGFIVELFWASEDVTKAEKRTFAYVTHGQTTFYTGQNPGHIDEVLSSHANPYEWEQTWDVEGNGGFTTQSGVKPGRMLTFWHQKLPIGELIVDTDAEIAQANRELNLLWSVLFDTLRWQGYAIPVLGVMNPNDPRAKRRHGLRFPLVLKAGVETADMLSSSINYSQQVDVLKTFVKTLAVAKRQSPNEFALEGFANVASGFSKIVDSLPKIDAREERLRRLTYIEEEVAWPRESAIFVHQGQLPPAVLQLRKHVEFEGIRFPRTEDERTKRHEFDLKHGLTTPAKIMAEEKRIPVEDAQRIIDENREVNGSRPLDGEEQPRTPFATSGGLFGNLIRQSGTRRDA